MVCSIQEKSVNPITLLIVEDDVTSQLILKGMLAKYALTIVDSGEAAIEAAVDAPDMVILDINLPGMDGYETCCRLRSMEQTCAVPILFLSSYTDLEDRLHAYGVGGDDYISKPFDVTELLTKIELHGKSLEQKQKIAQDLANSHSMLMGLQTTTAKIQSISRFIQSTLFCHDTDMLFQRFFKTAREIDVGCVLQIQTANGVETRASSGDISALEREILELSSTMDRIHSFGHDRAIFRWGRATLLTRTVGDMIDTIALFMDALEAGIKSVESESNLLSQVENLGIQNSLVRDKVTDLFKLMNSELKETILSLGLISLDQDEEDRLHDVIDGFSLRIDAELKTLGDNNHVMEQLINELRTPPPELQALMEEGSDEDDEDGGGVELF